MDTSIPLSGKTSQIDSTMDLMRKAMEIKRLQLENEQRQRELDKTKWQSTIDHAPATNVPVDPPSEEPPATLPADFKFGSAQKLPDSIYSGSLMNGLIWRYASHESRVFLIYGIFQMTNFIIEVEDPAPLSVLHIPVGLTANEAISFLDEIYDHEENLCIPIIMAVNAISIKMHNPDKFQEFIAKIRDTSAKAK